MLRKIFILISWDTMFNFFCHLHTIEFVSYLNDFKLGFLNFNLLRFKCSCLKKTDSLIMQKIFIIALTHILLRKIQIDLVM